MSQMPTKYRVTHNGEPLSFGKVFFYRSSGNSPAITYKTPGLSSANTNPVILDENGEADIYLDEFSYREVVYSSSGALIRTRDGISGDSLSTSKANSLYVQKGDAISVAAVTRDVISNVRTYTCALSGFSSYANGVMLGIIPDAVSGFETAFFINVNSLGDRRIYNSVGGLPSLVTGRQASLVFDGTNFIVSTSKALLAGQNSIDIAKSGTSETTVINASVSTGSAVLSASYTGGDAALELQAESINLVASSDEEVKINGNVAATRDWVSEEISSDATLWGTINSKIPASQKGGANGICPLDANEKIPAENIPPLGTIGGVVTPLVYFSANVGTGGQLITSTIAKVSFVFAPYNIGSGFNTSTWDFTAPVSGIYDFSWTVALDSGVSGLISALYIGETRKSSGAYTGVNSPYQVSVGSSKLYVQSGQVVSVRASILGSNNATQSACEFSGILLYPGTF